MIAAGNGNDYVAGDNGVVDFTVVEGIAIPTRAMSADYVYGGNDTIVAGNGVDSIIGGDGSDLITVGNGNDDIVLGDNGEIVQAFDANGNTLAFNSDGNLHREHRARTDCDGHRSHRHRQRQRRRCGDRGRDPQTRI